jgi:hypothetical protein
VSSVERFVRLALASVFLSFTASMSLAQVVATAPPLSTDLANYNDKWDAFGAYGYARFNTTVGHSLSGNLMGFKGQITGWVTPLVGITASTGNYYGSVAIPSNIYNITSATISEHLFLFGPEFRFYRQPKYTVAYHFLLGGTYGIFDNSFKSAGVEPNVVNLPNNQLAFALATGATFDYIINPKFSARAIIDFQPTHYGLAFQKDVAASVGVVYKWGMLKK